MTSVWNIWVYHNVVLYECDENICMNGGTCQLIAGDTICNCTDGYTGINCSKYTYIM